MWLCCVACLGCGSTGGGREPLVVFAASSLTEAFEDIERRFEDTHAGIDVQLVFSGSQLLRLQIEQGATADVFASANQAHLRSLHESGHAAAPQVFARNALVVIVPQGNPANIEHFDQLDRASRIVLGSEGVPVGHYAQQLLEDARAQRGDAFVDTIEAHVVSREPNVRLVRAKVELAEADAAIVYRTDAQASDRVDAIEIPRELETTVDDTLAALTRSTHPKAASTFVNYVVHGEGQSLLVAHGFEAGAR